MVWTAGDTGLVAWMNQVDTERAASGAWTPHTPTVTQSTTVTKTATNSRCNERGKLVTGSAYLNLTSAGTAGNGISVTLPVAARDGAVGLVVGSGWFFDTSTSTRYVLSAMLSGTGNLLFVQDTSAGSPFGVAPAVTIASGDVLTYSYEYESA
jgi:hypothetical protein